MQQNVYNTSTQRNIYYISTVNSCVLKKTKRVIFHCNFFTECLWEKRKLFWPAHLV